MIHIFQRSWPNPSADQLLHFLPFHNKPNLQRGRSGPEAWLSEPHASEPAATKHAEPGLREPEDGELQGWLARLRWPRLPDASTRSLRDGLEAQLAARVTRKSWAERSLRPRCASQGGLGVASGVRSSLGLTAWPHADPCRPRDGQTSGWANHPPPRKCFQSAARLCSFCRCYWQHCCLLHPARLSLPPPPFEYILKVVITQKIAEGAKTKAQSHQKQLLPSAF